MVAGPSTHQHRARSSATSAPDEPATPGDREYEAISTQTGSDHIPATADDRDRYERTLVDGDFLTRISTFHDVTTDRTITQEHPSC